jgi:molybdenum cofactor cytidylyltransferase
VSRIAGVILAAGLSRRLGRPKQLLELDGKPLVRHAAERALTSRLDELIVVTGAHADAIGRALAGLPVRLVHNDRYERGMGTSLAAAVQALGDDVDAIVVLLADQPAVLPVAIDRAIAARRETGAPVVMARYGEEQGHPVLFGEECFPELAALEGDAGGRDVVRAHRDRLALVDGGLPTPPADVDTEEAWDALRAAWTEQAL